MGNKSQKSTQKSTSTDPVFCASCGTPFAPPKSQASRIREDEYQDFLFDPQTKTSLLIATVYLPRCPNCTLNMIEAVKRAKPKKQAATLEFSKPKSEPEIAPKIAPAPQESE